MWKKRDNQKYYIAVQTSIGRFWTKICKIAPNFFWVISQSNGADVYVKVNNVWKWNVSNGNAIEMKNLACLRKEK